MMESKHIQSKGAEPNPEYPIKLIAEQGFSLESSLSDLLDNTVSATATKIKMVTNMDQEPFTFFITNNGNEIDEETFKVSMPFASNSPEEVRKGYDLG